MEFDQHQQEEARDSATTFEAERRSDVALWLEITPAAGRNSTISKTPSSVKVANFLAGSGPVVRKWRSEARLP